jgi:hypothetical protein
MEGDVTLGKARGYFWERLSDVSEAFRSVHIWRCMSEVGEVHGQAEGTLQLLALVFIRDQIPLFGPVLSAHVAWAITLTHNSLFCRNNGNLHKNLIENCYIFINVTVKKLYQAAFLRHTPTSHLTCICCHETELIPPYN